MTTIYDVTYRAGTCADAALAAAVLDSALARRTPEQIVNLLEIGGRCLLAEAGGAVIGVATARVFEYLHDEFPVGQRHVADSLGLLAPVGVVQAVVVLPEYRRNGIAAELVRQNLDWMRDRGALNGFSSAWVYPDGRIPVRSALIANGFTPMLTVAGYWTAESAEMDYVCDECGQPCTCSAMLFTHPLP